MMIDDAGGKTHNPSMGYPPDHHKKSRNIGFASNCSYSFNCIVLNTRKTFIIAIFLFFLFESEPCKED